MKKIVSACVLVSLALISAGAAAQLGELRSPGWAFQITAEDAPEVELEDPARIPGSTLTFTRERIGDLLNPPDWFPEENNPKPDIVVRGHDEAPVSLPHVDEHHLEKAVLHDLVVLHPALAATSVDFDPTARPPTFQA